MTTIEMLNELVTNGGMFEPVVEIPCDHYVRLHDLNGGVGWYGKKPNIQTGPFLFLSTDTMLTTWKRYTPPVDWSKVPVDTKVLCRRGTVWHRRYFAGVKDGKPTTFAKGATSWNTMGVRDGWDEMKLAEAE